MVQEAKPGEGIQGQAEIDRSQGELMRRKYMLILKQSGLSEREYFVLRSHMDNMKQREIARELGISQQAVSQTISRAIQKVKAVAGDKELFV